MIKNLLPYLSLNLTLLLTLTLPLTWSCQREPSVVQPDLTPYPLTLPHGFPEPDFPEDNALTQARVQLGKKLFYDPILSRDSTVSCNSCHVQELAFAHDVAISPGIEGRLGFRNAPTLVNLAYAKAVNKDGGVVKLDIQAVVPMEDEEEMDFQGILAARRMQQIPEYVDLCQKAYGDEPSTYIISRALASFIRTMVSGNALYDQYLEGKAALSESALRGKELFFSDRLQCSSCHSGFNFTDNSFQHNGLYKTHEDLGRMRITHQPEDEGKFRVPTLRNVALTAPYMHDGSLATLHDVLEHYNSGGVEHPNKSDKIRPLHLTEREKLDIIEFLHTLTDSSFLVDPAFQL